MPAAGPVVIHNPVKELLQCVASFHLPLIDMEHTANTRTHEDAQRNTYISQDNHSMNC